MERPSALLVDIDGVLVVSWEPVPGAVEALAAIRSADIPCRFLTNSTVATRVELAARLREVGFDLDVDDVLTTTAATASYLQSEHPGARVLLLNSGDLTDELVSVDLVGEGVPPSEVDVVVLGGAGPEFSYAALNRVLQCLMEGAELVAMHRSGLWRTSEGLQLDSGAYVTALEAVTQVQATVIGKPSAAMFLAGLESLGSVAADTAMVGDDINTDVRAAQAVGIRGVQVRTGKFTASQMDNGEPPDALIDSFAELPRWLGI